MPFQRSVLLALAFVTVSTTANADGGPRYLADPVAFKTSRAKFRAALRSNPKIALRHAGRVAKLGYGYVIGGGLIGAAVTATPAILMQDARIAVAGAAVSGVANIAAASRDFIHVAREQTTQDLVARRVIAPSVAKSWRAAELFERASMPPKR